MDVTMQQAPGRIGLYDPRNEHDSCGVAFVANLHGERSNELVATGLRALTNMEHRGATGAEPDSGDGAGILIQVPDRFFREVVDFKLPPAGAYAVGAAFLPTDPVSSQQAMAAVETSVVEAGLTVLGWRDLPVAPDCLGVTAREAMPIFKQLFVSDPGGATGIELDRKAFVARKRSRRELVDEMDTYFCSLSSRTIVYKGMLTTPQLTEFFPDLVDPRVESALLIVHSRFSTNTFPSWPLAHPYRFLAHNGEINTVQGNQNWMRAREAMLESPDLPGIERSFPTCTPGSSDTARFDEVLEMLHLGGYPIHHAMLMMIPEAWENHATMPQDQRDFYRFHSAMMEPWDGPASVAFTDGELIGAVLDRNGLRPSRYWVTDDDLVVMASEVGVVEVEPDKVVAKGRLQPGKMFLIDTNKGRVVGDEEVKAELAAEHPYGEWLAAGMVELPDLPERKHVVFSHDSVLRRQQMFGYTHEELKILITPMAARGMEALGSMGTDTPLAVLSDRPRLLFDYFKQLFAQVTNPPLDAIREEVVTAVNASVGPEANLLDPGPGSCQQLALPFPIIDNDDLAKIIHINDDGEHSGLQARVISGLYRVNDGGPGLRAALERVSTEASEAIRDGARLIVLSDRNADTVDAPIPSLLLTAAVHHHLVRTKQRTMAGLIVEAGDAREVHHMALLIGFGAGAINPYLAFESIEDLIAEDMHGLGAIEKTTAINNYIKACGKGVLKVMSKMGVSTVASYTGAQIFEAIGLGPDVVNQYFTGTISQLGGIGLDEIAGEVAARHKMANPRRPEDRAHRHLELGGEYQWRREGEPHLFNPETVFKLQHAARSRRYDLFKEYTAKVDDQSAELMTLRGLFEFASDRTAVSIEEVEPAEGILKRFSTGAMSYGSISAEAHETMAIAMNHIGAKSNTGEGGENPERLYDPERRSSIKQVASGRFGVTSEYLTNADDIQIKMAQGAKPGEGGQLPGHKVYPWIASTRHSTPGVGLISPPPHHDIYSIEDLKQLIHDLKNANPSARIHVKLVAETGVGTVAAGVSKAKADVVLISGHDGGTGASPLTSLKHAGGPWELGLAETQQTLLLN
ncbi:MAG: glutamate synthase large subunit, partial [Ilumatobacteraceae bacterium]|nr:glutamate synthase large subunit [Ilumatobacteraceae bacterium]